jgi:hypothetical protein
MDSDEQALKHEDLREFAIALATFLDERQADPKFHLAPALAKGLSESERQTRGVQVQGVRMAVADLLEMTRDWAPAEVAAVDGWLIARGLRSLSALREQVWKRVPKILARGRIRNDVEYRLMVERLNDLGPDSLGGQQRQTAAHLVAEYERARKSDIDSG